MKKLFLLSCSVFLLAGCAPEKAPDTILDIKTIAGKSLADVEQALGQADQVEEFKSYPCEYGDCDKAVFQGGKYEIIFAAEKANRIQINDTPDLTDQKNAVMALGLQDASPEFSNAGTTVRWKYHDGFDEIAFFTDYILIDMHKQDFLKK